MTPALKWMLPSKTRAMHQLSVKSSCDRGTWSKIRNCAHCLLLTVLRPCLWLHLQQCNCWTQEKHMPSVHIFAYKHFYMCTLCGCLYILFECNNRVCISDNTCITTLWRNTATCLF
jgi:hypothetical protein